MFILMYLFTGCHSRGLLLA